MAFFFFSYRFRTSWILSSNGRKYRKLFREQRLQRHLRVHDEAEDFREHITFWKPDFLWINSCARHHRIDQILLIFAVHDGEAARVTERGAVPAQNPVSNRMECPAPESAGIHWQQIRDAIQHFTGCFVREREQQNISRIDAVFEQVRHAICKRARFARACSGDHKDRAGRSSHRRELLFVQLRGVVNVDRRGYRRALQGVLTRHVLVAHPDLDCGCKELQQSDVRKSRV